MPPDAHHGRPGAPLSLPTSFSGAFADPVWQRFVAAARPSSCGVGEVLLRRGDPPSGVWVVRSGRLEAVDPRSSPPTVLGTYAAGAVLGEMSYLDGSPVSADVRVAEAGEFVHLPADVLTSELDRSPELASAFLRGTLAALLERARRLSSTAVVERALREVEPTFFYRDQPPTERELALAALLAEGLDPHLAATLADVGAGLVEVRVDADRLRIGRSRECDLILPDARVAPVHAELIQVEGAWRVVSVGSRAVVVRGMPVASAPLPRDGRFEVGRYALQLRGHRLDVRPMGSPFLLCVEGLGRDLGSRALLEGVTLAALSGEVVAVVGPSGSGKSTLLNAVRGGGDRGSVRLGGEPLSAVVDRDPAVVGEVPQDDIVLPELTVEESLTLCASLRLPGTDPAVRASAVSSLIEELGLGTMRDHRIGDVDRRGISGGQRKRVNIAQELLTPSTRVLLLDEPTSGLDPRSAADLARLMRRLADQGRVVMVVTHDLGEALVAQVDHLLVLTPGGRLAWFGPPADACEHFHVRQPAEIFDRLADRPPEEWVDRYSSSDARRLWVDARLRANVEARLPPSLPTPPPRPSVASRAAVLARRVALGKSREPSTIAVMVAQPALVASVMLLVFPRATSSLVFLVVLACFWFGMSAAVRELIADRMIWRRERQLGIPATAWVGAKAAVLAPAVGLQALAVTAAAWVAGGFGRMGFDPLALAGTAALTGWAGMSVGLLVSAYWKRSEAAVGTIALILIPQIAFSGVLMPLGEVRGPAWVVSWLTPVRYAFELALRCGQRLEYLGAAGWYERPVSGELYLLGFRPPGEGIEAMPAGVWVAVLVGCTLAGLVGATLLLRRPNA